MAKKKTGKKNTDVGSADSAGASHMSDVAKEHLDSLHFVNEQILQKNNELQIADSARIVYSSALAEEVRNARPKN